MKDSKLKAFIPLFYLVWSDDLLTQKEFVTLQNFILSQDWLNTKEQEILLSNLDSKTPPTRTTINSWKSEIETVINENPTLKSTFEIAILLSDNENSSKDLRAAFIQLENDLGISGEEIITDFKNKSNSLTSNLHTKLLLTWLFIEKKSMIGAKYLPKKI